MNKGKRVCMLSFSPMLFDSRIQKEAIALRDAGYQVKNIYMEDQEYLAGIENLETAQASYDDYMKGIETIPVLFWSKKLNKTFRPLFYLVFGFELLFKFSWLMLRTKADYYHIHDIEPGVFGWLGKFIHRGKLVYDAHENELERRGEKMRKYLKAYEKFIIKRAVLAITVNEDIKEKMETLYEQSVLQIANRPNYISFDSIDSGRLRRTLGLSDKQKIIMYVGYVTPWIRGIEVVLESLDSLDKNVCFLIMGVGRLDDFKRHVEKFVEDKGIPHIMERVQFIGPFPPDDIVHYLYDADVSMLLYQSKLSTNLINNAPNKFYQSIMARTPVLASHNNTFPKYIYDNQYGKIGETVDESSVDNVTDKIKLMLDPELQKEYRKNADLLAAEVSWQAEANKLVEAYSQLG